MKRRDWSAAENRLIVADYFDMLARELAGVESNKARRNEDLRALLEGRSRGSVEYKHQNISAILNDMGLPFVDGYKPALNYQASLVRAVEDFLRASQDAHGLFENVATSVPIPTAPAVRDYDEKLVAPPTPIIRERPPEHDRAGSRHPVRPSLRFDYPERDAANRQLGRLGEEFVLEVERSRLRRANRSDLVGQIEHTSHVHGDGLGYDVRSFNGDGREIFIEVKTTNYGKRFPFIVSPNEVAVSEELDESYRLYRVFAFSRDPRCFQLPGPISKSCVLRSRSFLARVG